MRRQAAGPDSTGRANVDSVLGNEATLRPGAHSGSRRATLALLLLAVLALALGAAAAVSPAAAQSRTLKLFFTHTKETLEVTYKRNGRYVPSALREVNRFLRDWRRNESATIDPELLDLVWEVYREVGAKQPVHVVSAYRSPATNNMLRQRSRGVAQQSHHMAGRAMDFYIPGVPIGKLREAAFKKQVGGVGYYPSSGSPFVHLDTGRVRAWPRMSRTELVKLFPDGKTLHLPSDGKPLQGYAAAQALEKAGKLASVGGGGGFRLPSLGFGRGGDGGGGIVVASAGPETGVIRPGSTRSEGGAVVAAVLSSERAQRAEAALASADPEEAEDQADEGERRRWGIGGLIGRFTGSGGTDEAPAGETAVASAPAAGDTALPGVAAAAADAPPAKVPIPRAAPRRAPAQDGDQRTPIIVAALPQAQPIGFLSDPTLLGYSAADPVIERGGASPLRATASLLPAALPSDPPPILARAGAPGAAARLDAGGFAAGAPAAPSGALGAAAGERPAAAAGLVAPNPRDPMLLAAYAPIEGEWFGELIPHDSEAILGGGSGVLSGHLDGPPLRFTTSDAGTWAQTDRFRGISIVVFAPPRG